MPLDLRRLLNSGTGLKVLGGVLLGAALLFGFFWLRERQFDAQLAILKLKNDQQRAEIDRLIGALGEQNRQLEASAQALEQVNRRLAGQERQLAEQSRLLREERDRRIAAVPSLTTIELASETSRILWLTELGIQPQPDDTLVFTDVAGRANLKALLEGQAAIAELPLANQRIANLASQMQNLDSALTDVRRIVSNKDQELALQSNRAGLREAELNKEIQVLKAQARKRHFIWAALGFIGGAIVAAF